MRTIISGLLLFIFILQVSCADEKAVNALTQAEHEAGWRLLFDGKTTDGWRIFKGGQVSGWRIEDGVLCNSGVGSDHGGDIITDEIFHDFELYLEWKIDRESNSGVFYHVQEVDSISALYESGPEYQLRDDAGRSEGINANQLSGAGYGLYAPRNAHVKPLGQWNETRIRVKGPHVTHWLNGEKVVEYELWSDDWYKRKSKSKWKEAPYYGVAKEGHIGLQDHGGLTCFKNIKVREL